MPDLPTKYVQLHGPCAIRILDATTLQLYFYDETGTVIINPDEPFILDIKTTGRVKFLKSVMLGELTEHGFEIHKNLLEKVAGGLTWQDADSPGPETMPNMNPIHPPKTTPKPVVG